jgi:hypothetical protein
MNALIYAINEINNTIPYELLHAGFTIDETPETINLTSLDDKILRKILKKRVLIDANIVGGIETIIPLNNVPPSYFEYFYTIYQIPPELTMNKEIISALNITLMPGNGIFGNGNVNYGAFGNMGFNRDIPLMNVANRIGNAAAPAGTLSNAHIEIVGYNTILIYANYRVLTNFGLRVILENDSNLNNIQPRSYKAFSLLCILAVKAYLYNKLIIAINSGYLASGQDLGTFKSILESYSDAEEQYRTYLNEKIGAVLYMNDTTRYNRLLNSLIAPDL